MRSLSKFWICVNVGVLRRAVTPLLCGLVGSNPTMSTIKYWAVYWSTIDPCKIDSDTVHQEYCGVAQSGRAPGSYPGGRWVVANLTQPVKHVAVCWGSKPVKAGAKRIAFICNSHIGSIPIDMFMWDQYFIWAARIGGITLDLQFRDRGSSPRRSTAFYNLKSPSSALWGCENGNGLA